MIELELAVRAVAEARGSGQEPLRLLLVEDEALVALEMEVFLTGAGHRVVGTAADHAAALALARRLQRPPDLALVDMRLADGSSGLQVAADLSALGIPVLFVTGNCPAERGRGLALGCLHKPFTEGELLASVAVAEAVLRQHPPARVPPAMHLY